MTNQRWAETASKIFLQKAEQTYELNFQILYLKQFLTCLPRLEFYKAYDYQRGYKIFFHVLTGEIQRD